MSNLINKFIEGLNIPEKVSNNLFQKRSNEELKVFALNIPDLEYPDTYILAGRLLIYVNIKLCPSKIEDYVDILTDILHPNIKEFILKNKEKIDSVLEETYYENFSKQNILSASANLIYLLRISHDEPPVETPCMCKMRQAIQFYHEESIEKVLKCYYELVQNLYVHASPTMFNAGLVKGQMASCMLLNLGDNLENLLDSGAGDVGKLSKVQAGIGMSLNAIRHSNISNSGKSSGVMPFGEIYDKVIKCVNQGGKRNGAITLFLNDWHIDFLDFIRSRDNYTHNGVRFKTANISVFLTKLFMERVSKKGKWTLFCPAKAKIDGVKLLRLSGPDFEKLYLELEEEAPKRLKEFEEFDLEIKEMEKRINSDDSVDEEYIMKYHKKTKKRVRMKKNLIEYKEVDAFEIYKTICDMNVKSGMPYITYRDASNLKNNTMNIGSTEGLNLCLEITLPSSPDCISSCNLGHLNLKAFVKKDISSIKNINKENLKDFYDFKLMKEAVFSLVQNINKVIDYNYYPFDVRDEKDHLKILKRGKISRPNFENRPLGIGVSGLAETFALLKIAFDSEIAKHLNKMIFSAMYYYGSVQSNLLALKHGEYKTFKTGESKIFKDGKWENFKGSPLSNGYFQFDLWQAEAEYLKSIDRLQENIYKMEDNVPIQPCEWGEEGSWGELREKIVKEGVYNSMLLAPMPTASSSQLVRNAECFEAHQALIYSRKLVHGNITTFSEPFVQDMIDLGLWNKKVIDFINMDDGSIRYLDHFVKDNPSYFNNLRGDIILEIKELQNIHRGMYEISQKDTMMMSRQRGIYVDQSQSLNIYIPEPTKEQMMGVHMYSNALQLKTGMYYLRQNQASQTDRLTVDLEIKDYYAKLVEKLKIKKSKKKNVICTEEVCISCQ